MSTYEIMNLGILLVAFIDGKRYTLEELIMLDFLGKTIN